MHGGRTLEQGLTCVRSVTALCARLHPKLPSCLGGGLIAVCIHGCMDFAVECADFARLHRVTLSPCAG